LGAKVLDHEPLSLNHANSTQTEYSLELS